jgi:hypothetical protein
VAGAANLPLTTNLRSVRMDFTSLGHIEQGVFAHICRNGWPMRFTDVGRFETRDPLAPPQAPSLTFEWPVATKFWHWAAGLLRERMAFPERWGEEDADIRELVRPCQWLKDGCFIMFRALYTGEEHFGMGDFRPADKAFEHRAEFRRDEEGLKWGDVEHDAEELEKVMLTLLGIPSRFG